MSGGGTLTPVATSGIVYSPSRCGEYVSLAQVKEELGLESDLSDARLQGILDRISDKIDNALGHSFGRAIRIYHDMSGVTAATVEVTATQIELIRTIGGVEFSTVLTFAAYPTIGSLVDAIDDLDLGWVAVLMGEVPYEQASANLAVRAETSAFGMTNRQMLCLAQFTYCDDGKGEHSFFVPYPIRSVISVVEDTCLLSATSYQAKSSWLDKIGGCFDLLGCYHKGRWSCASPCNVCVTFIPRWFGRYPSAIINAVIALFQWEVEGLADGTYKSESMGDYSYSKGDAHGVWMLNVGPLSGFKAGMPFAI